MSAVVDTKTRILDAAERLFSERGFNGTSMRDITGVADANLAAVNYHFGSKERLLEEVFARRVLPLNARRMALLEDLEAHYPQGIPDVSLIVRCYVAPALLLTRGLGTQGSLFMRLLGRAFAEPGPEARRHLPELYAEMKQRYLAAFTAALPTVPIEVIAWRLHFMIGALSYTMGGTDALNLIVNCPHCDPDDVESVTEQLVAFVSAGLNAPVPA